MDQADIIERIYDHVENDRLEQAVMACVRLSRTTNDYLNAAVFLRELYTEKRDFSRIFAEDTQGLKEEAIKFLHERSFDIWLNGRKLPFSLGEDDDGQKLDVMPSAIADIEAEIPQMERSIEDLTVPQGMAPFDTAAFTDSYTRRKAGLRLRIKAGQTVRNRVKARCFNYAVTIEKQLQVQSKPELFLHEIQSEVNNFFSARSEDVYTKLQKAAQLAASREAEDRSLLLTEVRRAIKAVADYFYPPKTEPVVCADGIERHLNDAAYLNRLEEYTVRELSGSTASKLIEAELTLLMAFARRLNDISAKGVHADVSAAEGKQGLVGLYMFLFNLVSRLQLKQLAETSSGEAKTAVNNLS